MERMPSGKAEKRPRYVETLDWCLQRVRAQSSTEKFAVILEQGKRDLSGGRVPEWDFMMVLKELKFLLDADGPEDDYNMIQVELLIDEVRQKRRQQIEGQTGAMERPKEEPIPPYTSGMIEA